MPRPEPLYLTEAQIAERVGVPLSEWEPAAVILERQGLPAKEPLFRNRRYWPACRAFLDKRYNLGADFAPQGTPALDGEENWRVVGKPRR